MLPLSAIVSAAGPFAYSAACLGLAGLVAVFFFPPGKAPPHKDRRYHVLFRLPKWALMIAVMHAMLGLVYLYQEAGLNFARADFETVFAGVSVMLVSMISALVVISAALLANAARPRRD